MIVGFTITDFNGHEKEAVEYILRVCILESPDIAQNIVDAGPGVNIFSRSIDLSELLAQPFSATPIEVPEGKFLLVSAVDFNIELLYNGEILRFVPTEYIYIERDEILQFISYLQQKVVRVIPDVGFDGNLWILEDGNWDDNGIWTDSNNWRDEK